MRYVNITSKHHDRFCLFRTNKKDCNSVQSPAKRNPWLAIRNTCRLRPLLARIGPALRNHGNTHLTEPAYWP